MDSGVVRGNRIPLVGLFTSSIAELSGVDPGTALIATPPPALMVPEVEVMKAASSEYQVLPL